MGRHGHDSWSPASASSRTRRRMPPAPSSPDQRTPRRPTPEEQTTHTHEEGRHQRSEGSRSVKKRKEKKLKSNYFHLILQEAEKSGSRPLSEIRRSELLQKVPVPGQEKLVDGSVANAVETTPKLRHLLIALKNLIFRLKGARKSLKGNFDVINLVWIPASKQIKFRKIEEKHFKKYKERRGKEDCHSIAETVEGMLHGYDLPEDLKHWLTLLKSKPYGNKYLVQNHMCLLAPIAKLQQFVYLYGEMQQLYLKLERLQVLKRKLGAKTDFLREERDHRKEQINRGFTVFEEQYQELSAAYDDAKKEHQAVMDEMTSCLHKKSTILMTVRCGDTETGSNWRDRAINNGYLKEVLSHLRGSCDKLIGAAGILDFVRNCTQHIMIQSVTREGDVKFSYLQIVTIICHAFPKLFHEFQEAMCNQGIKDPSFA